MHLLPLESPGRTVSDGTVGPLAPGTTANRSRVAREMLFAVRSRPILIDPNDADEWFTGNRIGFDHQQPVDGGMIRVLLEKDFACIDRPGGEEADDVYAFPNPSATC
jgi:hypothetical protein